MRDGFEGANVDDIARAAGVSKATLYSYFPDKSHMFMAVLTNECARHSVSGELALAPSHRCALEHDGDPLGLGFGELGDHASV